MSWKKVKLGDIATVTSSKRIFARQYTNTGIPFYRQKEIIDKKNKLEITEPLFISKNTYLEIKNKFGAPQKGDLLITAVGVTLGIAYVVRDEEFYFKDGNLIWLKDFIEEVNSHYIYYWVNSDVGQKSMWSRTIGSAQPALTIDTIKQFEIKLPTLNKQNKIADILSNYDNLIENNQKQIKLLEEAAQRLYKEWFVDLHFPGYENTPITDGIPEGWNKKMLGEIVPILTGKKDANFGTQDGNYPFFTCSQEPIKAPSYSFDTSAVILAGNGDFNVKLYRGKFEAYQRTYVLSPDNLKHLYLLYYAVNSNMNKLVKGASGSTIKFLTKGMIESIEILIPTENVLLQFNQLMEEIQRKIEILKKSAVHATEARDRLLPKLMSGEIEV